MDHEADDSQAIFESLNSTGKALSKTDLIRNYLLMGFKLDEQKKIYKKLCQPMENVFNDSVKVMEDFFRDYLTMKLASIPDKMAVLYNFKFYHINCKF